MRWIIWYIRSAFCNHTWKFDEATFESSGDISYKKGIRISALCTKCSYHRSFWKHI